MESTTLENSLLLTERQAANLLSISPRKLWGLRKDGEIAYLKSGRSIRYDVSDLEAWIMQNKQLPTPSDN